MIYIRSQYFKTHFSNTIFGGVLKLHFASMLLSCNYHDSNHFLQEYHRFQCSVFFDQRSNCVFYSQSPIFFSNSYRYRQHKQRRNQSLLGSHGGQYTLPMAYPLVLLVWHSGQQLRFVFPNKIQIQYLYSFTNIKLPMFHIKKKKYHTKIYIFF